MNRRLSFAKGFPSFRKRLLSLVLTAALMLAVTGAGAAADLQNVGGVLRYYDENGREAEAIGLDVSFYNNQIDWAALKAQGFSFAIVRIGGRGWGTGGLYGDHLTQGYLRGAREAGLKLGVYFYSSARNPAEALEEAQSALRELNGLELDLPLFLDMELSGDYPDGRADSLSPSERAAVVETFCRAVQAGGCRAGLYASEGFCRYNLDYDAVAQFPLWMASYTLDNQLPQYLDGYLIWQQTDAARAGGVDGPFDLDIILP